MNAATPSSADLLFKMLAYAFIEIRASAYEHKDKISYGLADMFHNLPDVLRRAAIAECSFDEALEFLREQARERGSERWIDHTIQHIQRVEQDLLDLHPIQESA